jgi:hypothetical protein
MCQSGRMDFFDRVARPPAPAAEPVRRQRPLPAWVKPETEIPIVVPLAPLVARSEDAVLAVAAVRAYSTGFEFELVAVLRRAERRGFPPWVTHWHPDRHDEAVPDEFIRVGLQLADGSKVTNLDHIVPPSLDEEPRRPILMMGGGGGGNRRYDLSYWVWPLPPAGPVTMVLQCPARGIPQTRFQLDGTAIREAAGRALELWPGEPSMVDDWSPRSYGVLGASEGVGEQPE